MNRLVEYDVIDIYGLDTLYYNQTSSSSKFASLERCFVRREWLNRYLPPNPNETTDAQHEAQDHPGGA